jgi:uncharacterized damage-inducible protein DinB
MTSIPTCLIIGRRFEFAAPEDQQPATMIKDDIQLLFEYDRWANNRVLQAASVLRAEQFTHDLGGSFCSIRDTLVHIIGGEWGWLTYWKEVAPDPSFLKNLWDRHDILFHPARFPTINEVRSKWTEVEGEQIDFLNGLTNESLETMLPIRTTEISLGNLMQHLVNHSTYHRGQVALMMRQLNAQPVATDFHLFLLSGCR